MHLSIKQKAIGAVFLLIVILLLACLRTVPPANVGLISTAGNLWPTTYQPGCYFTTPISKLTTFSTKTLLLEQENHVPTSEGLTVDLEIGLLYHIDPTRVREIFLELGTKYAEVFILPELSSIARSLTSEVEAKALYTEARHLLQTKLQEDLAAKLAPRGIVLEDLLLKAVKLPDQLIQSINEKAQAEQESDRMTFVLSKERQEAERKTIEATGISDFQRIVSEGISPNLLQWKGIEATEKLAESKNAKIVVMGNTKNSLPVILSSTP